MFWTMENATVLTRELVAMHYETFSAKEKATIVRYAAKIGVAKAIPQTQDSILNRCSISSTTIGVCKSLPQSDLQFFSTNSVLTIVRSR